MSEQQSKMLAQLSDEFKKFHKEALTGEPDELDERVQRLRSIHQLYEMTNDFPVWPFNSDNIRWFAAVVSSPVAVAAALGARVFFS